MMKVKSHSALKPRGFTLLELVVASAISAVVMIVVVRVVSVMLEQSQRSIGRVSRVAEIENVKQYLETDIQAAVSNEGWLGAFRFREPGHGWGTEGWVAVVNDTKPRVEVISTGADVSDSILEERWGKEGVQAAWIVNDPLKGLNDPGGLKVVSYQLKRTRISDGHLPRYFLMRSEASAAQVLKEGYRLDAGEYEQGSFSDDAFWAASVVRHPNRNHVLASNVIDFGLRAYSRNRDSGAWRLVFPGGGELLERSFKPELWVVLVRVLSDEGAERIENIEQGRSMQDWWKVAEQYSEVTSFTIRSL